MIIVEGPDGSGKSTLISKLTTVFPELRTMPAESEQQRRGRLNAPAVTTRARTYKALAREFKGSKGPYIYDRLHWSELVYGPIMRGTCAFDLKERIFIDDMFLKLGTLIIICLPTDIETLSFAVSLSQAQPAEVERNHKRICQGYRKVATDIRFRHQSITYNYVREDVEELVPTIMAHIDGRKFRTW